MYCGSETRHQTKYCTDRSSECSSSLFDSQCMRSMLAIKCEPRFVRPGSFQSMSDWHRHYRQLRHNWGLIVLVCCRLTVMSLSADPIKVLLEVPTTPACTWWNRPEEDPSSGKLESTHPSRTSVKYDHVFFGVESIMRVNAASLDIRDATTSTPGTLNDLTTDLIMANNNKVLLEP